MGDVFNIHDQMLCRPPRDSPVQDTDFNSSSISMSINTPLPATLVIYFHNQRSDWLCYLLGNRFNCYHIAQFQRLLCLTVLKGPSIFDCLVFTVALLNFNGKRLWKAQKNWDQQNLADKTEIPLNGVSLKRVATEPCKREDIDQIHWIVEVLEWNCINQWRWLIHMQMDFTSPPDKWRLWVSWR